MSYPQEMAARMSGLDSRRADVAKRIGLLLQNEPGIMLIGSWATEEAHLPPYQGMVVVSESDVDFVSLDHCTEPAQRRIVSGTLSALTDVGISATKVSIRPFAQLAHAPHVLEWSLGSQALPLKQDSDRFITFWSLVSAVEGCIRIVSQRSCHQTLVSYAACKFFFTLARNLAVLEGTPLRTYCNLAQWVEHRFPSVPGSAAFAMKMGWLEDLPIEATAKLVGSGGFIHALRPRFSVLFGAVGSAGDDLINALEIGVVVRAEPYLSAAWSLAIDKFTRDIVRYEGMKWRRALATCT